MGVSKVELANMALDNIGVDRIASLEETSAAARRISQRVDQAINSVLERSDWSFARRVQALAEEVNTDWTERFERRYDLPSDCFKARYLVPAIDMPNAPRIPFWIMGTKLYTNEPDAKLAYTYHNDQTTFWPQSFVDAVAFYLARALSIPLTRKRQLYTDMNDLYEYHLGLAIQLDAGQMQETYVYPSEYVAERGGRDSYGDATGADGSTYWSSR